MSLADTARADPSNRSVEADTALAGFDAVVMLTWSDWHKEPRSNRYHYATRFARHRPVYFVQPSHKARAISFEPVAGLDVTLVHVPDAYDAAQARALAQALAERGVRKPLLWIYNVYFERFIRMSAARLKVYHATEDYLTRPEGWQVSDGSLREPLLDVLQEVNLLVAVSPGVAESYRSLGQYAGRTAVIPNGCDFEFWKDSGAAAWHPPEDGAKVALYQGGVNARLDYALLDKLAAAKPDWQFWFCGHARDGGPGWARLSKRANVRHLGELDSAGIARLAAQALVGLIPFRQDRLIRQSLPLKAWEYVACGLPVVTVPIDALADRPEFFDAEMTPAGFAAALDRLAPTRNDGEAVRRRLAAAAEQSYGRRFGDLCGAIRATREAMRGARARLNLLLVYDDKSLKVRTIAEHIEAIQRYSRHNVVLMVGTGTAAGANAPPDLAHFDAILLHYSVRVSLPDHLAERMAEAITAFGGPKILFAQDEYENTETARRWMERLGIDALFTNIPLAEVEKVYPRERFPDLAMVHTLTGYAPEDPALDDFAQPLAERRLLIGYRGRQLPHHYGILGQQKWRIGVEMKRLAGERGLPVDIEVDDEKRIYGQDWYRFLGSCRGTLGTESGANVFDVDGELKNLAFAERHRPFPEFAAAHLAGRDGEVDMSQVSPKIFEAIRLRTALVLFEGSYSGVVEAHRHYIPLAQDFSNADDVFAKLQDLDYLRELTDRAFREIIESGRHSYRAFVEGVDAHVDGCGLGRARARILSVPLLAVYGDRYVVPLSPWTMRQAAIGSVALDRSLRKRLREALRRLPMNRPGARHPDRLRLEQSRLQLLVEAFKDKVRSMPWLIRLIRRARGIDQNG